MTTANKELILIQFDYHFLNSNSRDIISLIGGERSKCPVHACIIELINSEACNCLEGDYS